MFTPGALLRRARIGLGFFLKAVAQFRGVTPALLGPAAEKELVDDCPGESGQRFDFRTVGGGVRLVRSEDGHLAHLLPCPGAPEFGLQFAEASGAEVNEVSDLANGHRFFTAILVSSVLAKRPVISSRLVPRVALTPSTRAVM